MMSKREVAEFLGTSIRAVARYAEKGKLTPTYSKRPEGGQEVHYSRKEVEALKREMDAPQPRPDALTRPASTARQVEILAQALAPRDDAKAPKVALHHKHTLNISEACALSGLGRGAIESAIDAGAIEAKPLGPHGARVVRRVDLERYVDALWAQKRRRS